MLILYLAIDIVEFTNIFNIGADSLFKVYVFKLPSALSFLLAPAVSLGASLCKADIHRSGELDAIQAAGIGTLRIVFYLICVSIIAVPLSFLLSFVLVPTATAKFEAEIRGFSVNTETLNNFLWTFQNDAFVRIIDNGNIDELLNIDDQGLALKRFTRKSDKDVSIERSQEIIAWDAESGWRIEKGVNIFSDQVLFKPPAFSAANVLPGQSLSSEELKQAAIIAQNIGLSDGALRAEKALRKAIVAACIVISTLVLTIMFVFQIKNAGAAALVSLAVTALYWLASAVAWNGTASEIWHDYWLSIGVPVLFAIASTTLFWMNRRTVI